MSEDGWEPNLESDKEPPSDDESRGRGKLMEQAVAWAVIAPRMRKTGRQDSEANHSGTQGLTTCG